MLQQVRMLADLDLVGCYNKSSMPKLQRDSLMLASAKANLEKMSYFGLTSEQTVSQYLFEETFNLEFKVAFETYNSTNSGRTKDKLPEEVSENIRKLNTLDIELYEFAVKLLKERFKQMQAMDHSYDDH